jgi:hypothetical protein
MPMPMSAWKKFHGSSESMNIEMLATPGLTIAKVSTTTAPR